MEERTLLDIMSPLTSSKMPSKRKGGWVGGVAVFQACMSVVAKTDSIISGIKIVLGKNS